MTSQQRITLGLQIFCLFIGILLLLQGEFIMAFLPFLLGLGGIAWQGSTDENDKESRGI